MHDPDYLIKELDQHVETRISADAVAQARRNFSYLGYAKVPFLAPQTVKEAVADEVNRLIEGASVRRDLEFKETDYSPRRMRNVRRAEIAEYGNVIKRLYSAEPLLRAMSRVAGEQVLLCPYEPEQFVITYLERDGDTHGWHWDDYSFALVWVLECPPVQDGGFVQCVPGTTWNKNNPQINKTLVSRPIYSIELFPGDLYLMRTDTTLHRVYPVQNGRRKIINMGYASAADLRRPMSHETMDNLWADPALTGE